MLRHIPRCLGLLKFAALAGLTTCLVTTDAQLAGAGTPWEGFAISPVLDLVTQPLDLDSRWYGGLLRVRLTGSGSLPPNWQIHLDYGNGRTIDLDPTTAAGRVVGTTGRDQLTIDLPVLASHRLTAQVKPQGLRLLAVTVLFPSRVHSEQMIGKERKIDLFDANVGPSEILVGPGFGRVDLLTDRGVSIGSCTGFRVGTGYWLTAAHCVVRDIDEPERPVISTIRIQPLDYVDHEGARLLAAIPIATGQSNGQPDPTKYLQPTELDYAVLQVQDDPGGYAFTLGGAVFGKPGDELQLFQHWTGSFPPPPGKARCADSACLLYPRTGPNDPNRPELCPDALQHGCSSEPGASGGPVVMRSTLQLIGLHYRGGLPNVFNCALPAGTIIKHLCANKPDLARRITSCD